MVPAPVHLSLTETRLLRVSTWTMTWRGSEGAPDVIVGPMGLTRDRRARSQKASSQHTRAPLQYTPCSISAAPKPLLQRCVVPYTIMRCSVPCFYGRPPAARCMWASPPQLTGYRVSICDGRANSAIQRTDSAVNYNRDQTWLTLKAIKVTLPELRITTLPVSHTQDRGFSAWRLAIFPEDAFGVEAYSFRPTHAPLTCSCHSHLDYRYLLTSSIMCTEWFTRLFSNCDITRYSLCRYQTSASPS
ncbi:hypothetical protein CC85DRAFT_92329 [Cutaneotrichosporon oleaginosum]|uniref:Uncharacterized protein n=1 Tax=Cutaneotrichosporon oleaginosum TaxID=879819 RepID=A0A0J0XMK5_9TREE|nr:uncharacterized protein CC85DRAFT_92329 [Cutaneotrichosporon oleaginosum]KLT42336.1 hypothetical protein CC85DRAFT_92329 [Cutaneotrichosporon oleaginosum]TXT04156.1 hypothetical protein COLE_07853 [Cutaneotrichosporon oleaginosum]